MKRTSTDKSTRAGVPETPARAGRPQEPERTRAILDATVELLAEVGYEALSIGAVADRAQASKATIYRRWSDKRELVVAALAHMTFDQPVVPAPADNLRDDLLGLARTQRQLMKSGDSRIFTGLLHAAQRDPEIAAAMHHDLAENQREECAQIVQRAIARGELTAETSATRLFDLVSGQIILRSVMQHKRITDEFLESLVDEVLIPVLTRNRGNQPT